MRNARASASAEERKSPEQRPAHLRRNCCAKGRFLLGKEQQAQLQAGCSV